MIMPLNAYIERHLCQTVHCLSEIKDPMSKVDTSSVPCISGPVHHTYQKKI